MVRNKSNLKITLLGMGEAVLMDQLPGSPLDVPIHQTLNGPCIMAVCCPHTPSWTKGPMDLTATKVRLGLIGR